MASGQQGVPPASRAEAFDERLVRARAGCADSLGELLQGCRRYLLLTATRTLDSDLRPKEGASDLVQETFVVAHRDFQSFRGSTLGELLGWLHRILEHQLANHARFYKRTGKRSLRREVPLDAGPSGAPLAVTDRQPQPDDEAARLDEERRVHQAMARLPEVYQRVLTLRTWQRLPFAEIGRELGRSADAAEKLWMRAVERLDAELRNSNEPPSPLGKEAG